MAVKTEGKHTAEFLVSEANGTRSRDQVTVTVPANTTLAAGTVLSQLSANGKFAEYDNAGSDGTEEADAVLYETLINNTANPVDVEATVIARDAEVRSADLVFKSGVDNTGKTAARADLATKGIIAR